MRIAIDLTRFIFGGIAGILACAMFGGMIGSIWAALTEPYPMIWGMVALSFFFASGFFSQVRNYFLPESSTTKQ